ncbi:hypothetical protein EsDP_00006299 [Epichloe bromicola]|uniref:WSC domain-containing protein n=1 Tax=Epichloe bromicola TaxID=79588 RepID=A0ABQ0CXM5_9HYPO
MALRALLITATTLMGLVNGVADTDTITWGGDNSRAGYQTNHNMDPTVVASNQFGQLFRTKLPGTFDGQAEQVFSQPLVYTPSGSVKQYVYFATTQNNVYKLDAKTGQVVASRNLHIPFLTADLDGCVDINPTVGVTSTGVIDPATDTLYLTAKTYLDQKVAGAQGRPNGRYYAHALDVNDLSERPNFPVDLEGLIASNTGERTFQGGIHLQRPALLHTGNFIYAGFASHCVQYNFTGWIIGWDKTSGKIVEKWATEGQGVPNTIKGGGIWMSGGGIASDDKGSMFLATGNGYASQLADVPVGGFNPPTSLEEAALHMTINADGSLRLVDFFMPWEKRALDGADKDLGTSPLEILPSQFSCGAVRRIGVVTGKSGKTYFLNLDDLGGYKNGKDGLDRVIYVYENLNSVYSGAGVYPLEGGYVYINVIQHPSIVLKFSCSGGVPGFTKVAETPQNNAYVLGTSHGTTTSLNGQEGTGLLWVTDVQGLGLRVYDAVPKAGSLNMIQSFNIPGVNKFSRPVFGDGIVYIGSNQGYLYGFGSPVNVPLNCTSPVDFGSVNIKNSSLSKPVICKARIALTVTGIELNDAKSKDFTISGLPTTPLQMAVDDTFTVNAQFSPSSVGLSSNDILVNTTNGAGGYSSSTHARLTGTGKSAGPLFQVSPIIVTFKKAVTGQDSHGVTETVLASNLGSRLLTVQSVLYSTTSTDGPFQSWDGQGTALTVGKFTFGNIPTTIQPDDASSINIKFDTSESGTSSCYIRVVTDGGNGTFSVAASAGPGAVAQFEFQTPDGTGWVNHTSGTPFTFGNVTENNSKSLNFRVTNAAPRGGVPLSLTVSKPPFGVAGLVRALNQVDLAEGTSLAPGESANATLVCNAPYAQWNTAPYNGTAHWTMNTNDPNSGKQLIEFLCNAVAEQAPPLLPNGQGQFRYVGCYKDNTPGRQLSNQILANDNMTNADCIKGCHAKGLTFCATQYQRECWAGNTIPTTKVSDANCNYYCKGDVKQVCGGNGNIGNDGTYMSLFADTLKWDGNTAQSAPPPEPVVNPGVSAYISVGCYTESTNGRALPNGKATDKQTVKNCVDACKASNYIYAGVEYGGEVSWQILLLVPFDSLANISQCWCGNAWGGGAVPAPAADCKMTCNDNSTEYCGGPSRLNAYRLGNGTSSSTTAATAATLPVTSSTSSFSNLTLISASGSDAVVSTTTTVTSATSNIVMSSATTPSTPTPTAPYRRAKVGNWVHQGCWTEATNGRALVDRTYANDSMTLDSCAKFCHGLTYFGVEYGRECYCGNALQTGSVNATNQADCSFLCPGDKSQYCGAGVRLELYKIGPAQVLTASSSAQTLFEERIGDTVDSTTTPASKSSPSTTSAAATTTSTTTTTTTTTAVNSTTGASSAASTSTSAPASGSSLTPTTSPAPVNSSAAATNSPVISTRSVVAANFAASASRLPPTSSSVVSTSSSTFSSSSNPPSSTSSATGTSKKASSTTASTQSVSPTPTGPVISNGNSNFTYYGCVLEPNNGRILQKQLLNHVNMTINMCLQTCWKYNYAGVEYGRECWCGNKVNYGGRAATTPGKNVTNSQCNFLCPGNKTEYCGSQVRLSLYSRKNLPSALTGRCLE